MDITVVRTQTMGDQMAHLPDGLILAQLALAIILSDWAFLVVELMGHGILVLQMVT